MRMHKTTAGKDLVFQIQSEFLGLKLSNAVNPIFAAKKSTFKLRTRFSRNAFI